MERKHSHPTVEAIWRVAATAASLAAAGCMLVEPALKPEFTKPAFTTSEAEFRERINTICIETLTIGLEVSEPEARRSEFEGLIADGLRTGGFEVVPASKVREAVGAISTQGDGCFDPVTGRRDADRCEVRRQWERTELRRQLACDATLAPSIARVTARFAENMVEWDGAMRYFPGGGFGWVMAVSLYIEIRDLDGREIYWRSGGIEPLSSLRHGFLRARFDPQPADRALSDSLRNRSSVLIGLGPLGGPDRPDMRTCMFGAPLSDRKLFLARCELQILSPPSNEAEPLQPDTEASPEDNPPTPPMTAP